MYSLVVIRMLVAPIPVMFLHGVMHFLILMIFLVLFMKVMPVSAVLAVVPVVIVMMAVVIDADLKAGILRFGNGCNECTCCKCGSQEQGPTDESCVTHEAILQNRVDGV